MSKKYTLEIYEPGGMNDAEVTFESDTPFLSISVGDLLNNRTWPNANYDGNIRLVTKVEHYIWVVDEKVKHKVGVYTSSIQDNEKTRS